MRRRLSVQLMAAITVTLAIMLGANLVLVWRQQEQAVLMEMHSKAHIMTQELLATRLFIARNQDRINRSETGHIEFKGLNPAAVGRGVGSIFHELTGAQIKQTRVDPRRHENSPDTFDLEALAVFEQDRSLREYFKQVTYGEVVTYRYAVPLNTERECLACHGEPAGVPDIAGYTREGLQEGDLAGAISVMLPMADSIALIRRNTMVQGAVVVGVTAATLLVIWVLSRRLVTLPMERLARVAGAIGDGNLKVQTSDLLLLHGSRELGIVADNMETMAKNLHELYSSLEEKVAERTRELAQANQVQTQFLATVSHELRTPLTSIIAFTELLLKQDPTGRQREYLEDVLESSRRLLSMVNDLLDLSRLNAGRVELFADVLDLPELVHQVERSVRPLADRKDITLSVAFAPDLPLVMVDPLRMKQVLLNLLSNAIKFTPEGGRVSIDARQADTAVQVDVRDTGPGIPAAHHELVFEAFRRIEAPGYQHPGSGLGLALARNLVELHGGRLWVENPPEGGSLFRFTIPVVPMTGDSEEEGCDADAEERSGG